MSENGHCEDSSVAQVLASQAHGTAFDFEEPNK